MSSEPATCFPKLCQRLTYQERGSSQATVFESHRPSDSLYSIYRRQHHPKMTRRIVYGVSLWLFIGAAACTIASVALPNWVSYTSPTNHDPIRITYGLHKRCSSITGECIAFPQYEDCHGEDKYFCSMWRSTGFAVNFSLMLELACVVAYVTVLAGGRGVRESGWKILAGLLSLVAAGQLVAMALVVSQAHGVCVVNERRMLIVRRPIFMIMITASSLAGN